MRYLRRSYSVLAIHFLSALDSSGHQDNHSQKARAKAHSLFRRNERLCYFLAMLAALSIREFDNLVDVVWLNVREVATFAGAFPGKYFRDFGRPEALLPRPFTRFLDVGFLGADSLPLAKGLSLEGGLFEFVEFCLSLASSCSMRSLRVWVSPCKT